MDFKREFPFEESLRIFEVLGSHYLELNSDKALVETDKAIAKEFELDGEEGGRVGGREGRRKRGREGRVKRKKREWEKGTDGRGVREGGREEGKRREG